MIPQNPNDQFDSFFLSLLEVDLLVLSTQAVPAFSVLHVRSVNMPSMPMAAQFWARLFSALLFGSRSQFLFLKKVKSVPKLLVTKKVWETSISSCQAFRESGVRACENPVALLANMLW